MPSIRMEHIDRAVERLGTDPERIAEWLNERLEAGVTHRYLAESDLGVESRVVDQVARGWAWPVADDVLVIARAHVLRGLALGLILADILAQEERLDEKSKHRSNHEDQPGWT